MACQGDAAQADKSVGGPCHSVQKCPDQCVVSSMTFAVSRMQCLLSAQTGFYSQPLLDKYFLFACYVSDSVLSKTRIRE